MTSLFVPILSRKSILRTYFAKNRIKDEIIERPRVLYYKLYNYSNSSSECKFLRCPKSVLWVGRVRRPVRRRLQNFLCIKNMVKLKMSILHLSMLHTVCNSSLKFIDEQTSFPSSYKMILMVMW